MDYPTAFGAYVEFMGARPVPADFDGAADR